jgi:hypothetical protein
MGIVQYAIRLRCFRKHKVKDPKGGEEEKEEEEEEEEEKEKKKKVVLC